MLIDGFEKFQKNFELSDEEIDTLKITFIKEIFANSKFFLLVFNSEDTAVWSVPDFLENMKSFVTIILEMDVI